MLLVLLVASFVVGLILVPLGLPGLWVMVVSLFGYALLGDFQQIGFQTLVLATALAAGGEVLELIIGWRFAQKHGASRRAGWGAIVGGLAGTLMGMPIPLLGTVVGGFLGAFLGAALFEATGNTEWRKFVAAGWGAILGKAAAAAVKVGLGIGIAIIGLYAAFD